MSDDRSYQVPADIADNLSDNRSHQVPADIADNTTLQVGHDRVRAGVHRLFLA